jgi:hypothetical protein
LAHVVLADVENRALVAVAARRGVVSGAIRTWVDAVADAVSIVVEERRAIGAAKVDVAFASNLPRLRTLGAVTVA